MAQAHRCAYQRKGRKSYAFRVDLEQSVAKVATGRRRPLPLAWWVGKDDILRHSYGTYRAAILRNSHNLAEEMGNSVTMVRTYYDAVVSPSVAKLWWRIRPAKPKNLIPMKAAA